MADKVVGSSDRARWREPQRRRSFQTLEGRVLCFNFSLLEAVFCSLLHSGLVLIILFSLKSLVGTWETRYVLKSFC